MITRVISVTIDLATAGFMDRSHDLGDSIGAFWHLAAGKA